MNIKQKSLAELNADELLKLPALQLFALIYDEDNIEAIYSNNPPLEQRMEKLAHYYDKYCEMKNLGDVDILLTQDDEDAEYTSKEDSPSFFAFFVSFVNFLINLFFGEKEKPENAARRPSILASTDPVLMANAADKLYLKQNQQKTVTQGTTIHNAEVNEGSSPRTYRAGI